jgi:hypothetical protein
LVTRGDFFKDTAFYIDHFHSHEHTACTEASFLDPYMQQDAFLRGVNSSAAECGNAGLVKIRKLSATRSRKPQAHSLVFTSAAKTEKLSREGNSTLELLVERYPRMMELWPTWLKLQAL